MLWVYCSRQDILMCPSGHVYVSLSMYEKIGVPDLLYYISSYGAQAAVCWGGRRPLRQVFMATKAAETSFLP